jgi:SAM-dependent methyltransferase
VRTVALPPGARGRLVLDGMPGRGQAFGAAEAAIVSAGVGHVVCLTGLEEIRRASPEYHAALARGVPWQHHPFPIGDFGAPADRVAFCALAKRVADLLLDGERVMVHCRAGIGRTGLLATAVLMALGRPRGEAVAAVEAAGSRPETGAQVEMLDWIAGAPDRVAEAYDRVAEAWLAARQAGTRSPSARVLDAFAAPLPAGAAVLDLGCGGGVPVARDLVARGFRVTGLDASGAMIDHARRAVPQATFVRGDMRTADPGGSFDGIVAWDSVFHVPRAEQAGLFRRLGGWLRPGGRLLISLGGSDGEFVAEMLGEALFFAAHEPAAARAALEAAGLAIETWEVDDPSSRGHLAALATRR